MTKYSYYAVVLNHDTGKFFVDEDFIAETMNGVIYDHETGGWEFADTIPSPLHTIDSEGVWDLQEALRGLNQIVEDRK